MNSFDWNRLAIASLLSGSILIGTWAISHVIIPGSSFVSSTFAEDQSNEKLDINAANIEKGKLIAAQQCGVCHNFKANAPDKIGPTLYNITNRPIASIKNFTYSNSLKTHQKERWTINNLNQWLHKPMTFSPATIMAYAGLSSNQDRADVIAYLQTLSTSPTLTNKTQTPPDDSSKQKISKEQIDKGKQAFLQNCSVCHTIHPSDPNRLGPNLYDIIDKPIASKTNYNYSNALKNKKTVWNKDNLDQWLEKPQQWAPNNKMIYQGIKSPEMRQNIISYMQSVSEKSGQK